MHFCIKRLVIEQRTNEYVRTCVFDLIHPQFKVHEIIQINWFLTPRTINSLLNQIDVTRIMNQDQLIASDPYSPDNWSLLPRSNQTTGNRALPCNYICIEFMGHNIHIQHTNWTHAPWNTFGLVINFNDSPFNEGHAWLW